MCWCSSAYCTHRSDTIKFLPPFLFDSLLTTIMPKKIAPKKSKEELVEEEKKPKRTQNWNQNDTEFLAQLVMDHGRVGILSKETNVSTNKQRDIEWDIVNKHFNASAMV